jgi:hypothetical protein
VIARLLVQLPFAIAVPDGAEFWVYRYEDDGCEVRLYPPGRSDQSTIDGSIDVKIDGRPAFLAEVLRIDFLRESFSRDPDVLDPLDAVVKRAVDSFVARLRHVCNAAQARPVDFPLVTWHLQYLDDDEQELEKVESLVRGRGGRASSFSYVGMDEAVWEDVHSLPQDYQTEAWEELLLEAQFELPRIGPAIVLAATALEVLISQSLDALATASDSAALWRWLNGRKDVLKRPTVEEQFDALLRLFTGHSLKEESRLWDAFMHLKQARNSFVHTCVAMLGRKPVSIETAGQLVQAASDVVAAVREWLPEKQRWPVSRHDLQLETMVWPFGRPAEGSVPVEETDSGTETEI